MRTQRRAYLFQRCIFGGKLDRVSRFFVGLQKVRKMDCEDARKNENMQNRNMVRRHPCLRKGNAIIFNP